MLLRLKNKLEEESIELMLVAISIGSIELYPVIDLYYYPLYYILTAMHKDDHSQIYEMLSVLFLTLSKGEQVQQCIREVLTSHPLFSPLPLFKHIAKGSSTIKKEHLLSFIEENREQAEEE